MSLRTILKKEFLQVKSYIILAKNFRCQSLKDVSSSGIIILRVTQSDQPETLVEAVKDIISFYI